MKPICIKMQEFGVYTETVTVDFTKLNSKNIFLITGATGGGKTTILDAISFALYCRSTGGSRTFKSMRNVSSNTNAPTIVDFTFSLSGVVYRFKRTYIISKVRGSNKLKDKYEHECYQQKNGEWCLLASGSESKVREVAEKLIGLDHEQFDKVIILPQGEFKNLLLAKPSQKAQIFQKLFMTDYWNKISDASMSFSKNLKKQIDDLNTKIDTILLSNNVKNIDELILKKQNLENNIIECKDTLLYLDKNLNIIIQKVEQVKEITNYKNLLNDNLEKQKFLLEEFKKIKINFSKAENLKKDIPSLNKQNKVILIEIDRLEQLLSKHNEICKIDENLQNLKKDYDILISNESVFNKKLSQNKDNIKSGENYIQLSIEKIELIPYLYIQKEKIEHVIQQYIELEKIKIEHTEAEKKHKEVKHQLDKSIIKREALRSSLNEIEENMKKDAALTLSSLLHDGEPCPVCGSLSHPSPVQPINQDFKIPPKKQILLLKQNLEDENSIFDKLNTELSVSLIELKKLQNQYLEQTVKCNELDLSKDKAQEKLDSLIPQLEDCAKAKDLLNKAKIKLSKLKSEQEQILKNLENNTTKINELSKNMDILESRKKIIISELEKSNIHDDNNITQAIHDRKKAVLDNELKIEKIQHSYDSLKCELEKIKSNIDDINIRINSNSQIYNNLLNEFKLENQNEAYYKEKHEKITKEINEQNQILGNLNRQILSTNEALTTLEKIIDSKQKLEEKYSSITKIALIMNGNNPLKVPIKIFVLGIALDDVLSCANIYFSRLSNNRYSLSRVTDKIVISNGQNGLSIEIFDAHYGACRDVHTLSGGELFLASLSLALGLSDVVQSYSGGIHLDSIFIDEGFGSLDSFTLDTAISALNEIQKMGRIVGIISHVEELKNRIPAKIEVFKNKNGIQQVSVCAE